MPEFEIEVSDTGAIRLAGRFDAAQVDKALTAFRAVTESCTVDFQELDYISSAGLGVLLETQKRLAEDGHGLTLVRMNPHVRLVFEYAGFHYVFAIE